MAPPPPSALGVYLHIPFCRVKCPYCSFNVYVKRQASWRPYVEAVLRELALHRAALDDRDASLLRAADGRPALGTIYLGGGTPSLLSTEQLGAILDAVRSQFAVSDDAEITVETEPGTTGPETFAELVALGVNRVTVGAQSFTPARLSRLGRAHGVQDIAPAIEAARRAGVNNLDLDLMFGLPEQTEAEFADDLDAALALEPEHLSLYNLTIEQGTPFGVAERKGQLPLPDEDTQAAMMRRALRRCAEAGYEHYEISNFARPGYASRHNQGYWQGRPYLGVGAGAHGFAPLGGEGGWGRRSWNLKAPEAYASAVARGELPTEGSEELTREQALLEAVYLGMRQRRGLDRRALRARFGPAPCRSWSPTLRSMQENRLIEVDEASVRLTEDGVIIADYIIDTLCARLDTRSGSDTVVL